MDRRFRVVAVLALLIAAAVLGVALGVARSGSPREWTSAKPVRGLYISWGCCRAEHATAAGLGFNAVSVGAYRDRLDHLKSLGLKGLVWLGGFDNTTCRFIFTDRQVTRKVKSIRGHPAVLGYEIDNDPTSRRARTHRSRSSVELRSFARSSAPRSSSTS